MPDQAWILRGGAHVWRLPLSRLAAAGSVPVHYTSSSCSTLCDQHGELRCQPTGLLLSIVLPALCQGVTGDMSWSQIRPGMGRCRTIYVHKGGRLSCRAASKLQRWLSSPPNRMLWLGP